MTVMFLVLGLVFQGLVLGWCFWWKMLRKYLFDGIWMDCLHDISAEKEFLESAQETRTSSSVVMMFRRIFWDNGVILHILFYCYPFYLVIVLKILNSSCIWITLLSDKLEEWEDEIWLTLFLTSFHHSWFLSIIVISSLLNMKYWSHCRILYT